MIVFKVNAINKVIFTTITVTVLNFHDGRVDSFPGLLNICLESNSLSFSSAKNRSKTSLKNVIIAELCARMRPRLFVTLVGAMVTFLT